jgi:hypothetical protein
LEKVQRIAEFKTKIFKIFDASYKAMSYIKDKDGRLIKIIPGIAINSDIRDEGLFDGLAEVQLIFAGRLFDVIIIDFPHDI